MHGARTVQADIQYINTFDFYRLVDEKMRAKGWDGQIYDESLNQSVMETLLVDYKIWPECWKSLLDDSQRSSLMKEAAASRRQRRAS
ncbi:hypothetical protein BJF93_08055 [Xaviernesmea oryzae]|uniref:Uncharacterized protein n=1 Tax=Xaviernesmea oryzae TaxID=464029 RepID=A0A1Q9B0M7_9HYPH|nr:hypothetical protein [Xaviernesmea oryzae]OLP61563.1 hypothetical protein BJF93_08055 [Xaviernesmea oryzae]SEL08264.1 hypothetical protein SAMN04487976_105315 [Xaviernesmea oryzae]